MKAQLEGWQREVETSLPAVDEVRGLEQLRVKYLGKKGLITLAVREIGKLSPAERPVLGKVANDVKTTIERLIAARLEARRARNFAESDRIRDELGAAGILLEDGPTGTTWRRK